MPRRHRTSSDSQGPNGAIGQRLRRLVEWTLAGSFSAAAIGCGANEVGANLQTLEDSQAWDQVPCGDLLLATDPIAVADPLDYIGVYTSNPSQLSVTWKVSDYGNPCEHASDVAACLATLSQRLAAPPSCDPTSPFCTPFVVTTRGDGVDRYDSPDALAPLLAPIDRSSEAVLMAQLRGLHLTCRSFTAQASDLGTFVQRTDSGYLVHSKWDECGNSVGDQMLEVRRDGSGAFMANTSMRSNCTPGRRPAGLTLAHAAANDSAVAAFLAQCAQLEAASVPAFRRLERELARLGASQLSAAARASARDEVRHTRTMTRLAQRYGASVAAPKVSSPSRQRTAAEIAHENAVEGCVRETFSALLAWHQAARARDPQVALDMRGIAADETRHAELAWRVAAWLEPRLCARERAAVNAARAEALRRLDAEIDHETLPETARAAIGWPSVREQHAMLQRMASELALS